MVDSVYEPLGEDEFRILNLAPGSFKSDLEFTITHTSREDTRTDGPARARMTLRELQETLPKPWKAYETIDGRFFFGDPTDNLTTTHPAPGFDRVLYGGYPSVRENVTKYEALSYAWGSKRWPVKAYVIKSSREIASSTAKGTSHNERKTIKIGRNLAKALRHLRYKDKWRTLWVDALCINQQDIFERSHQVKKIAELYQHAHRVVIWLGTSTTDSALAISTLDHLGKNGIAMKDGVSLEPRKFQDHSKDWYDARTWQSLASLFSRDWFYRLWVCQEVQLSNYRTIVQCGHDEMKWTDMRVALHILRWRRMQYSQKLLDEVTNAFHLARDCTNTPLEYSMVNLSWKLCSDPRDKVHALLGLMAKTYTDEIVTDYCSRVSDVYKNFFMIHLQHSHRLDLLAHSTVSFSESDYPSWIPDWTAPLLLLPLLSSFVTGMSSASARYVEPNMLEVGGMVIGSLRSVSKSMQEQDSVDQIPELRKWTPKDLNDGLYPTGEDKRVAFSTALRCGYVNERNPGHYQPTTAGFADGYWRAISAEKPTELTKDITFHDTCNSLWLRRFAISCSGLYGLVPTDAQPGDQIVIVLGCYCALILRPDDKGYFKVIGDAYFHGEASGEALFGPFPENWSMRFEEDEKGLKTPKYHNSVTREITDEDPRLWPLPVDWERVPAIRQSSDPYVFSRFRNTLTGKTIHTDPRLTEEALRARGVALQTFKLT